MQSFNDFFNARKKQVATMCSYFNRSTNCRIEYDDLFQEASLKLLEIYKDKKPLDINYSLTAVKNHLINYIKKNSIDREVPKGLLRQFL